MSNVINYVISQEKLIDELENATAKEVKEHQVLVDETNSNHDILKEPEPEDHEPTPEPEPEIATYEKPEMEDDDDKKRKKLQIDVDEANAAKGFQNIKNAGRFWRASQIMGTRKHGIATKTCGEGCTSSTRSISSTDLLSQDQWTLTKMTLSSTRTWLVSCH